MSAFQDNPKQGIKIVQTICINKFAKTAEFNVLEA
jgi:hypothetical protein